MEAWHRYIICCGCRLRRKRLVLQRAALFRARYLLLCYNWTVTSNHTPPSVGTSALCAAPIWSSPLPRRWCWIVRLSSHCMLSAQLITVEIHPNFSRYQLVWQNCGASKQGRTFSQINCNQMIAAGFHNSCWTKTPIRPGHCQQFPCSRVHVVSELRCSFPGVVVTEAELAADCLQPPGREHKQCRYLDISTQIYLHRYLLRPAPAELQTRSWACTQLPVLTEERLQFVTWPGQCDAVTQRDKMWRDAVWQHVT